MHGSSKSYLVPGEGIPIHLHSGGATVAKHKAFVFGEHFAQSIMLVRGHKVLLDSDLAALYGVETKVLLQAVKRNLGRFPEDFMLHLTADEWPALRSQSVTLKTGRGQHRKYLPYVFTEQGVAMLSSVLNSDRAIAVNIEIMRAFVRMRELLASNKALAQQLKKLERKVSTHDAEIVSLLDAIRELMNPPDPSPRSIGFVELQERNKS